MAPRRVRAARSICVVLAATGVIAGPRRMRRQQWDRVLERGKRALVDCQRPGLGPRQHLAHCPGVDVADGHRDIHAHGHSDRDSDAHADPDAHTDPDPDPDPDAHTDPNSDAHTDPNSDADAHTDGVGRRLGGCGRLIGRCVSSRVCIGEPGFGLLVLVVVDLVAARPPAPCRPDCLVRARGAGPVQPCRVGESARRRDGGGALAGDLTRPDHGAGGDR